MFGSKTIQETESPAAARRPKAELAALLAIVAAGLLVVYGSFYAGARLFAYSDVGSDTLEQYVPFYLQLIRSVREGTFGLWNFAFGLGVSAVSYQSWLLDPFNLLLVPLGLALGESALAGILVAVQSVKVVLCALLMDALLAYFCEKPTSRVLGSVTFAFCGYLMLWGQHYWLGTVIVLAVGLVLAVERLYESWSAPRFLAVAAATALPALMSAYVGFMVMLFAATWAALRVAAQTGSACEWLRRFGALALPVVCGLLASCATLVPYAAFLLGESSRVGGSSAAAGLSASQLAGFVPLSWVPAILSRLLGTSLITAAAEIPEAVIAPTEAFQYVNVYEFIQLGLGCGAIVLLGQFAHWAWRDCDRRAKACVAAGAVLVALYCFNFLLPSLFNAFVGPKYRSVFAVAIPLVVAMSVGFDRRVAAGRVAAGPLMACGALTLAVLAWSLLSSVDTRRANAAYIVAAAVLVGALWLTGRAEKPAPALLALACTCMIGTSVLDAWLVTNARTTVAADAFPEASANEADASTREALAWIEEQEGEGSLYRVEKLYHDWTRYEDSLIQGFNGVTSYNSTLDGDVRAFYRMLWPEAVARGTAYQEYINDPDEPGLLRLLGVKYLLSVDELEWDWAEKVASFGDVAVYRVDGAGSLLSRASSLVGESEAEGMEAEERRALIEAGGAIVADEAAGLSAGGEVEAALTLVDASAIEGTATASAAAVACLAVPNTSTWTVKVDGVEVETFRCDYGFIGFTLEAGEHTIEASFSPAGLGTGTAISAFGLAATAVSCAVLARRAKREGYSEPANSAHTSM